MSWSCVRGQDGKRRLGNSVASVSIDLVMRQNEKAQTRFEDAAVQHGKPESRSNDGKGVKTPRRGMCEKMKRQLQAKA